MDDLGNILAVYRGTSLGDYDKLPKFRQYIYQVMTSAVVNQ